jgi:putative component of membrane protein insertase Oxa1/YidC/SpoIIIJ protein YidD
MKYLIFFIVTASFSQDNKYGKGLNSTDRQKWGKAAYLYIIPEPNGLVKRNYSLSGENFGGTILQSFADVYWFFISDVDGDNCSFNPTCSSFFMLAVKRTNILQGTLMFADRFTRDLNLFKLGYYPRMPDGHFYDPVNLYTLNKNDITSISPESFVKIE